MTPHQYLKSLHEVCQFQTREGAKIGLASNGELLRWIKNQALAINGIKVTADEVLDYPIFEVTLFTKQNKITIYSNWKKPMPMVRKFRPGEHKGWSQYPRKPGRRGWDKKEPYNEHVLGRIFGVIHYYTSHSPADVHKRWKQANVRWKKRFTVWNRGSVRYCNTYSVDRFL